MYYFRGNLSVIVEKISAPDVTRDPTEIEEALAPLNLHPENTPADTDAVFYRFSRSQVLAVDESGSTDIAYVYSAATGNLIKILRDVSLSDATTVYFQREGVLVPHTDKIVGVNFSGDRAYIFTNPSGTVSQKSYRYLWDRVSERVWRNRNELPSNFIASVTVNTSVYFVCDSQNPTLYLINGSENIPTFSFARSLHLEHYVFSPMALIAYGNSILIHAKYTKLQENRPRARPLRQITDHSVLFKIGRIDGQSPTVISKVTSFEDGPIPHSIVPIKHSEENIVTDGYVVVSTNGITPASYRFNFTHTQLGVNQGNGVAIKQFIQTNNVDVEGYEPHSFMELQKFAPTEIGERVRIKKIYLGAIIPTAVTVSIYASFDGGEKMEITSFEGDTDGKIEHLRNVTEDLGSGQFIQFSLEVENNHFGSNPPPFTLYSFEAELEQDPIE